jgi:hypothetical protein
MRHYSVRSLMAFVLASAVGLAALRNANDWWADMILLITLAAVGVAVLGAIILQGRDRCWWLGFVVFSGGYLALTFSSVVSMEIGSRLVTTRAFGFLHSQATADSSFEILWQQHARALTYIDTLKARNRRPGDPEFDLTMIRIGNLETQLSGAANRGAFVRIGHCLFALLAGLIGGIVAVWFYALRVWAEVIVEGAVHRSPPGGIP